MEITPVFMDVMVSKIYKKNYVMCRNPIYSSKYTLHRNKYSTTTAKTMEIHVIPHMPFYFSA